MTLNLTKPASEYEGQERQQLFAETVKAIYSEAKANNPTGLRTYQMAYAKGQAWKLMREAGF